MRTIILTLSLLIFLSLNNLQAQDSRGAITSEILQQIRTTYKETPDNNAVTNAVTHNEIKKLAINRENEGKVNHLISNKIETKAVTNQKKSGRCWLYTGLNTLRPLVTRKYNMDLFEFSQTYNFFWDQFEKANLYLEAIIATAHLPVDNRKVVWLFQNPVDDGGQWTTFSDNVKKYGLVPSSAMPDTYQSENTSMMSRLLKRKLREDGMRLREMAIQKTTEDAINKTKLEMLSDVYRILVLSLGEPPVEFTWQFEKKDGTISEAKTYTPKQFYDEVIGVNLDDYVMLMNDPSKEYYKLYEVEYDRNLAEGHNWKFINLPIQVIKDYAKASILNNEPMYFSCDVGKQLNIEKGTLDLNNYDYNSLMGVNFDMDKKNRILTHESGSTHGMALVGVNVLPDGKVDKWLLENSWGKDKGNNGYLTMTDDWFSEYMFRLVVNKQYVDAKVLKILDKKAIMLPPWDPVFAPEQ
jgi:bleomycin hydrolase